ncbi:MAG TPA: tRNA threonylcarbamoyladenosine dehydratase [Candidatus Omnitrophota bacterium]|nr:tRNA threonylcarbamoyladenosine dehydratase [Candidatus Omnitrophota bacterium]HRZ14347.1 tRNA threonylcarbamoyladenosine dehydratase [Candidatus Omnitrophota bacterium]
MERFLRTELIIGKHNLLKLHASSVTVLGLGAVGSYVVEALARAGVGSLRLADFDTVRPSNINRNLLAFESTVGEKKVAVAARRIRDIHPQCRVETADLFVDGQTIAGVADTGAALIIDAMDSLNPKTQTLAYLYQRRIPVISSMGAALRADVFAVRCGDLFEARGCVLAQQLRKRLRKYGIHKGIFCVYSQEPRLKQAVGDSATQEAYARGRARKQLGSLPTVPGIFGLTIAHCAIKFLLGELKLSSAE